MKWAGYAISMEETTLNGKSYAKKQLWRSQIYWVFGLCPLRKS
jgi:hypothetical protein